MADTKSSMKSLKAYEKIRDMILSGFKLPGTRLVLSELETELGIGRGPIREALMRLDRSGLVKNIPYKGAIVAAPPTQKEVLHIFDLRVDLECTLCVEAMENLTESHINSLEELHGKMEKLPPNHYQFDRQFHSLIYDASNLPHLCNIAQALTFSVESVLNIYQREKSHCIKFNTEHRAIIDALKSKKPEQVKKMIEINIKSGLEIIKDTYDRMVKGPNLS
ncbi:DNA-binding transcriptional regulator, GntR family [Desulfocicer vacuolatum DSM 3385]|uniref:DNA-binding transcriptional regulator, GntR family n=1 Tax=Desulfocicer vacuolatum DSM 3385 TaxID=1121400 RepID=A0A1W2DY72_9BACT|nr:GntR family transcriptional regulator [Desulfocicer vacuolatum]SMD02454.1 DNA-binding transcriptional regulator, GntR family [Desulfocicer vacuolatum DSM 3385]